MKLTTLFDHNNWHLINRLYATRCKREIALTEAIIKWFFETKEKSLDQIEDIIEAEWKSPSKSRIFWARRPVGKKSNGQPMNEQYIHMEKTNRFPFIEIHEPFLK